MILNILSFLTILTDCIYRFLEDLIDYISEKTNDMIFGCLYILIVSPFKILALFFEYLSRFTKMNKNYVRNKKAFVEWCRKNKEIEG